MLHPPKTAPSLKLVREKRRSKMHSLLPAHLFVLPCRYHAGRTRRMSPHGKFKAHRADGGTGWAFLETRTRKNIHTKTNLSLSLELFLLLQGNAETERPHTSPRKDSAQRRLCVFIQIYMYIVYLHIWNYYFIERKGFDPLLPAGVRWCWSSKSALLWSYE